MLIEVTEKKWDNQ